MSLVVISFGGEIKDAASGGVPVEIWNCNVSATGSGGFDPATNLAAVATAVHDWVVDPNAWIDPSVELQYCKVNLFDITTGHQITDPTVAYTYPANQRGHGGGSFIPAITTAYRVSIDDNTRSRTTKGGWYAPRTTMPVHYNGRFDPLQVASAAGAAQTFLGALNVISGLDVGVWSRKDHSVTTATRLRVGDVPDNISRRKDNLREVYTVLPIA